MRNKVQLIGNLGNTLEVKEINGHGKVANVSIATHENYRNSEGEWVTETTWHNLVLWNKLAEKAEKDFHRGTEVAIEGKITNHSYEGKDGVKRYVSEVLVNDYIIISNKAEPKSEVSTKDANPAKNRKTTKA